MQQDCEAMQNKQSNLEFSPYELIPYMTTKSIFSDTIAIHYDNTTLYVKEKGNIKVFMLNNESLKLIQIFSQPGSAVNTINIFKQQQYIVTASFMGYIVFRSSILKSDSKFLKRIQENITSINCLVLNSPQEDLIITGSNDHAIRFYQSKSTSPLCWECSQTITVHLNYVQALSLNQDGTKLISCGFDLKIFIMEGSNKQNWIVKQKIQTSWRGFRISFITDNIFACQITSKDVLDFYMFNSESGLYLLYKQLQVKGGKQFCALHFPSIYLKQQQLLLVKNGEYVNFIRFTNPPSSSQDLECILEQSIDFNTGQTYGTISNDGQYLITWDDNSKKIQVRKPKNRV